MILSNDDKPFVIWGLSLFLGDWVRFFFRKLFRGFSADSKALTYRPDVDGLRALAVFVILAFHLDVAAFSGGFVGVDIFFVISGYVILRRLLPSIEDGSFSFKDFYDRRARRILPGLLTVLAASMIVGAFLLPPAAYEEMAGSSLSSLLFAPNFFFHDRAGYFAGAAHEKPLLHMWSLGIEEQFYILMPLLLAGFWRFGKVSGRFVLGGVVLLSFLYNIISTPIDPNHAFYMPMSRLWEIGIGGLVALWEARRLSAVGLYSGALPLPMRRVMAVSGMVFLALAVMLFDRSTAFPGWASVLPVVGTGFLILAGFARGDEPRLVLSRLLSWAPVVRVGLISYALYLVHWPMVVFSKLILARPFTGSEQLFMALVMGVLAHALWVFVERPFRQREGGLSRQNMIKILGGFALVVAVFSGVVLLAKGVPSRFSSEVLQIQKNLDEAEAAAMRCREDDSLLAHTQRKQHVCVYDAPSGMASGRDVFLWGDSHAGMFAPWFAEAMHKQGRSVTWLGFPDCAPLIGVSVKHRKNPQGCAVFVRDVVELLTKRAAENKDLTLVIAGRWANLGSPVVAPGDGEASRVMQDLETEVRVSLQEVLPRTLRALSVLGIKIVVVGPVPEIAFDVPNGLMRVAAGVGALPAVTRGDFDLRQSDVFDALRLAKRVPRVSVVYPHRSLCNARRCEIFAGDHPFYSDDDHLSRFGVQRVLPDLLKAVR